MYVRNLIGVSLKSVFRHKSQTMVLAGGISVGVASLIFLFSLLTGVESTVAERIIKPFPKTHIRVEQSSESAVSSLANLNDTFIENMRKKPEVFKVFPRMRPDFPVEITVEIPAKFSAFVEERYQTLPVNVYGIDSEEVEAELGKKFLMPDKKGDPIPVLVNLDMFEALERGFIPAHFPFLVKKDIFSSIMRSAVLKGTLREELASWRVGAGIGSSISGDSAKAVVGLKLVGYSRKVPKFGISIPTKSLKEWYTLYYGTPDRPASYQDVVVVAKDPTQVGSITSELEKRGFAITSGKDVAEKVTMFFRFVQIGVSLIGTIILVLSGVGIFLGLTINVMLQASRIAILRAVGARRRDIAFIYVFEAAFIGVIGGILGIGLAFVAMLFADIFAVNKLPDFLFKPETFFLTPLWYLPASVAFGVLVTIVAGIIPALRAARTNVAGVLR